MPTSRDQFAGTRGTSPVLKTTVTPGHARTYHPASGPRPVDLGFSGTLLGPPVVELAQRLGVSIEDTVRFRAVTRECIRSRELARLSVRDVATGFALRNIVSPTSNRATSSESSPRRFGNTSARSASLVGMPSGLVWARSWRSGSRGRP